MTPDRETVQDLFLSFLGLEELGNRDEKDDSPLRNVLIIAAQCPYFLLFGSKFWTISCFNGMVVIVFVPFPFLLPYVSLDQPHKHTHNTMFLRIQCSVCISFYLDILDRVTSVCPAHIKIFEKKLKPEMMKLIKCAFSGVLYSVFCLLFCVGRFHVFHGLKVMEPIDSNEEILETNENKKKTLLIEWRQVKMCCCWEDGKRPPLMAGTYGQNRCCYNDVDEIHLILSLLAHCDGI